MLSSRPVILLFGDSITQQGFGWNDLINSGTASQPSVGWASLLARDYARRAHVLNYGYSGYNTQMALKVLPEIVGGRAALPGYCEDGLQQREQSQPQTNVLFATVFFGANDAALPGEHQHIPMEEYGQNLAQIVKSMRSNLPPYFQTTPSNKIGKESGSEQQACRPPRPPDNNDENQLPIVIFTPPPVDVNTWYRHRPPRKGSQNRRNDRANDNAKAYGDVAKKVALQTNCSVLDVYEVLGGSDGVEQYSENLRDGLHLSELGNIRVYNGLMVLLQQNFPQLLPMTSGLGKHGKPGSGIPLDGTLWHEYPN